MTKNMEIINFYVPDFVTGFPIYKKIFDLWKEYPIIFRDNVKISHIFGAFPSMLWNGGSYSIKNISLIKINEIIDYYTKMNIPLQFTMTNPLITEQDCYDRFCNTILKIADNGINEILVTSDILEQYIRKNFPRYKIDKSIIATVNQNIDYNEVLQKYDRVVLSRLLMEDFNFLQTIKPENRSRIELLVNETCPVDCPRLATHYLEFAKVQLFEFESKNPLTKCSNNFKRQYSWEFTDKQRVYSYSDIINTYLPLGFTEIKLAGRWKETSIINALVKYLVKEEYQADMFKVLMDEVLAYYEKK